MQATFTEGDSRESAAENLRAVLSALNEDLEFIQEVPRHLLWVVYSP